MVSRRRHEARLPAMHRPITRHIPDDHLVAADEVHLIPPHAQQIPTAAEAPQRIAHPPGRPDRGALRKPRQIAHPQADGLLAVELVQLHQSVPRRVVPVQRAGRPPVHVQLHIEEIRLPGTEDAHREQVVLQPRGRLQNAHQHRRPGDGITVCIPDMHIRQPVDEFAPAVLVDGQIRIEAAAVHLVYGDVIAPEGGRLLHAPISADGVVPHRVALADDHVHRALRFRVKGGCGNHAARQEQRQSGKHDQHSDPFHKSSSSLRQRSQIPAAAKVLPNRPCCRTDRSRRFICDVIKAHRRGAAVGVQRSEMQE